MEGEVKQAIVNATFEILKQKDMNSISVREIAAAAGVNVAAVSYYFGGKAELFSYMMELYWQDLCDLCREILNAETITKQMAEEFCLRYLKKEMNSTGILRSEQVMYQNYRVDTKTQERIALQFQAFTHFIQQCNPFLNPEEIKMEIISLLSALTHPAFWNELTGQMVDDANVFMVQYVKRLVEKVYKQI